MLKFKVEVTCNDNRLTKEQLKNMEDAINKNPLTLLTPKSREKIMFLQNLKEIIKEKNITNVQV